MAKSDIDKLIALGVEEVQRAHKGAALIATGVEALKDPDLWLPTGSWALDRICRGSNPGGIPIGPQGRVVHVGGEWSTSKSAWLDHLAKSVLGVGGIPYIAESEGSRDRHFADAIELDLRKVVIDRPDTVEEAFENFFKFHDRLRKVNPTLPILFGLDSIASSQTDASSEDTTQSGAWQYGGKLPQLLGVLLKKAVNRCARFPTTCVLLNQTRENIGVWYGAKKFTPGGNAPHFYASLEIMLNGATRRGKGGYVFEKYRGHAFTTEERKKYGLPADIAGNVKGRWIEALITKSKVSSTHGRSCQFYLDFFHGISPEAGFYELLLAEGIVAVTKGGEVLHYKRSAEEGDNGNAEKVVMASFKGTTEWAEWVVEHFSEALA